MNSLTRKFQDWLPLRVDRSGPTPSVEWCYIGNERFTEPFFEDTMRRHTGLPFNLLFRHRTSMDVLRALCEQCEVVPPTGFIFHMSRCGSTLVAQMLAALSTNIVVSEAPPVDSIINAKGSETERSEWLKWIVGVIGRKRYESERNYFLKLDSWNILELDFVRRTFPGTPLIFLYRNPVEVIASHMRQRGMQMVPGGPVESLLPEVSLTQALEMQAEEYCARILARFSSCALEAAADEKLLLINYDQLPAAVTDEIASHFGLTFTIDQLDEMKKAAKRDAKTPQLFFEPDSERKRTEASDAARSAAAAWVDPIYEQLENIRNRFAK